MLDLSPEAIEKVKAAAAANREAGGWVQPSGVPPTIEVEDEESDSSD